MKKISLVLLLLLVVSTLLQAADTIQWQTDWQQGLKTAAAQNRPVFLDFYTDWCPPCKRMKKTTFVDKGMLEYFKKEKYLLIKVNPEKDRIAEKKFKVYSYPTMLIFNGKGKEIDRLLGYQDAKQLIKALEDLKKGIGTLEDLLNHYQKTKGKAVKENFELISKIMNKYIARADYPQALELVNTVIALDKENKHEQAAGAMFQRGYIYFKWKKLKKAVDALMAIHKTYPHAKEAAGSIQAAIYYSGKMDEPKLTVKLLKRFVKVFPKEKFAEKAHKKIKKLEEELKENSGEKK